MMNVTSSQPDETRVLLWSPEGAGNRYPAPAMATYRMYMSGVGNSGGLRVSLAHGAPEHGPADLFDNTYSVGRYHRGALAQVSFLLSARKWLRHNIERFDVFHGVTSYHACLQPAAWSESRAVPAVVRIASYQGDLADKGGWRRVLGLARKRREIVGRLSGLIAISSSIAGELLSYGVDERRIALIPNGVDIQRFSPVQDEASKSRLRGELGWPDVPTVLLVSRVNRSKQPHHLLQAAARLRRNGTDMHLAFVGPVDDQAYFESLNAFVDEKGLKDRVTWNGFTQDVARCYRAADVFALPSIREGMPNVLLEAMATGLAVVSTRVSGATDAIEEGVTGTLIHDTEEAVFRAISEYLSDDRLRAEHGAAARRRVVDVFSASAVHAAHRRLFSAMRNSGDASDASLLSIHG